MIVLPWPPTVNTCAGVYRIDDVGSGCFYIGSAVNLLQRFRQHEYSLRNGKHSNKHLQNVWAVDKARLKFSVVSEMPGASKEDRLAAEQVLLNAANAGRNRNCFNVLSVAGSHQGAKRSEESRRRLSESQKGRTFSEETRAKMRAAKLGKPLSEDHKRKLGDAARGRPIKRPEGIINAEQRRLTPGDVRELRRLRNEGMSWSCLAKKAGINLAACRRAVIGITYKDVQ